MVGCPFPPLAFVEAVTGPAGCPLNERDLPT